MSSDPITNQSAAARSIECRQCHAQLPLRLTETGESGALWLCVSCGNSLVGVASPELGATTAASVRLADVHFDAHEQLDVPNNVLQLAERMNQGADSFRGTERRRSRRVAKKLFAPFVSLRDDYSVEGDPYNCLVIDLSEHGLGCITMREPTTNYVAIQFVPSRSRAIQLIGRIVRHTAFGGGYFHLGVDFSFRLGQSSNS